jgi:hypothetical protein
MIQPVYKLGTLQDFKFIRICKNTSSSFSNDENSQLTRNRRFCRFRELGQIFLYVFRHLLAKAKAEGIPTGFLSIGMYNLLPMKHLLLDPNATILALNNGENTNMVRNDVVFEGVG